MKKFLRYTLRTFIVLLSIVIVTITASIIYVSSHKQEIVDKVKKTLSEKLNGTVEIGGVELNFVENFPSVSVLISNLSIKDTMFQVHHHVFFQAEKVYAIIGIGNSLQRNNPLTGIRVDNGQLYLFTDTAGYTNEYLLSPKKSGDTATKPSTSKTEIESIRLKIVRITLDNQKKNKLYDFAVADLKCKIKTKGDVLTLKTSDDILIHNLAFNTEVGSYVKETPFEGDFTFTFDKTNKQLSFNDIEISLKKQEFKLSGQFNFTESPTFSLKVFSKNIDYELAKSLVTSKIATALSLVRLDKPVKEISADISGPLKGGEPLVIATWKLDKTSVQSQFVNLSECSMTGSYTNEITPGLPRNDPNSRLHFQKLSGVYEGLPVTCDNVYIDNLVYPVVNCDVKTSFDLSKLNDLLGSNTVSLQNGKGSIDITYSGPLQDNSNQNTLLNGKLTISDGVIAYKPRSMLISNVSGNILFKNSDVFVTDFKGNVQGNKIMMDGSGKNLLALIKTNPGRLFLEWNIYSPSLNLNSFTSLLKQRTAIAKSAAKSKLGSTASQLDEIVDYSNFRLKIKADELIYSKFNATNVKAILSLADENWKLEKITLEHAGGQMGINGSLNEKNATQYEASVKVNMDNVDVNKVMYAFNNFGQSGIESGNLKGKLTTTADVKLDIDRNTEQPSDINGYVDFSIKNGALLHYEPLKKVQTIIFKKRNFNEIYFAELKDKIEIKDKEITINRLEIQSTALTLFIDGVYSLKGKTDLSIQVPISNLKKRGEDYTPENKGSESKGGASIYLRGQTDADGTVGFKLDVFKKFRKKKN